MKCNIDGASKGNPGIAVYGGVIRDEDGYTKTIFHSHLGKATNNMAELMALEKCLEILRDSSRHNIMIEVDSEYIIRSVKKICNGSDWRLLQVYQHIQSHLRTMRTFSLFMFAKQPIGWRIFWQMKGYSVPKVIKNMTRWKPPQGRLREECHKQETLDRE